MTESVLWKGQSSRLFAGSVLFLSLFAFLLAEIIGEEGSKALYGVLSHLAAMLLAAFVAVVFFGFRDVRELMSASISSLLVDGDIAKHLAPSLRRRLRDSLLLEDMKGRASMLVPAVREHLEEVERHVLTLPHHHFYAATITNTELPGSPLRLRRHFRCSYVVSCRHLNGEKGTYYLTVGGELSNPGGATDYQLKLFKVRIGSREFGPTDATVKPTKSAGLDVIQFSLEASVEIHREAEVTVEYEIVAPPGDPTEIFVVRYPTAGFRVSLFYREDMKYDVAWLRTRTTPPSGDYFGREEAEITPRGITAYTQKWLLPGEGVTLVWFDGQGGSSAP